MDNNDSLINQITLDFLLNKKKYEKHVASKIERENHKNDIAKHKSQIIDLTEKLINEEHIDGLLPDVKYSFDNYIKCCIHYIGTFESNEQDKIVEKYNENDELDNEDNCEDKSENESKLNYDDIDEDEEDIEDTECNDNDDINDLFSDITENDSCNNNVKYYDIVKENESVNAITKQNKFLGSYKYLKNYSLDTYVKRKYK